MSSRIATINGVVVTEFCGPAHLKESVGARGCVQIGDDVILNANGAQRLHKLLGKWIETLPDEAVEPDLVIDDYGDES